MPLEDYLGVIILTPFLNCVSIPRFPVVLDVIISAFSDRLVAISRFLIKRPPGRYTHTLALTTTLFLVTSTLLTEAGCRTQWTLYWEGIRKIKVSSLKALKNYPGGVSLLRALSNIFVDSSDCRVFSGCNNFCDNRPTQCHLGFALLFKGHFLGFWESSGKVSVGNGQVLT